MTRILFTKISVWPQVLETLPDMACCFQEVISEDYLAFELPDFRNKDILLVSSVRAAKTLINKILSPTLPVFCIGKKTAEFLRSEGIQPSFVANYAADLSLPDTTGRLIHLCSDLVLPTAADLCSSLGIDYVPITTYRTLSLPLQSLPGQLGAVVLFSPSGARTYFKYNTFAGVRVYALGTTTKKTLEELGIMNVSVPETPDLTSLLALIRTEKDNFL